MKGNDRELISYYELLVNKFIEELRKRAAPTFNWKLVPRCYFSLSAELFVVFAGEQGFEVFGIYVESSFMGHGSCSNHGHCFGQWRSKLLHTFNNLFCLKCSF